MKNILNVACDLELLQLFTQAATEKNFDNKEGLLLGTQIILRGFAYGMPEDGFFDSSDFRDFCVGLACDGREISRKSMDIEAEFAGLVYIPAGVYGDDYSNEEDEELSFSWVPFDDLLGVFNRMNELAGNNE